MVHVVNKRCTHQRCARQSSYGKAGGKAEYCRDHAEDGMVDVDTKKCIHHRCIRQPSLGKAGGKAEYCRDHADDWMVDVTKNRCLNHSTVKRAARRPRPVEEETVVAAEANTAYPFMGLGRGRQGIQSGPETRFLSGEHLYLEITPFTWRFKRSAPESVEYGGMLVGHWCLLTYYVVRGSSSSSGVFCWWSKSDPPGGSQI